MLFYLVICSQVYVSSPFSARMDIKERTWNDHVSRVREALVDHNKHILDKHSVFMSLYSLRSSGRDSPLYCASERRPSLLQSHQRPDWPIECSPLPKASYCESLQVSGSDCGFYTLMQHGSRIRPLSTTDGVSGSGPDSFRSFISPVLRLHLVPLIVITLIVYELLASPNNAEKAGSKPEAGASLPLWLTFLFLAARAVASAEAMSLPPPGATPAGGSPLP